MNFFPSKLNYLLQQSSLFTSIRVFVWTFKISPGIMFVTKFSSFEFKTQVLVWTSHLNDSITTTKGNTCAFKQPYKHNQHALLVYMVWCGLRGTTELQGCKNRVVLGPEDSVWRWTLGVIIDVFWVWCSMQHHVAPWGTNFYSYPVLNAAWKQISWLPIDSNNRDLMP